MNSAMSKLLLIYCIIFALAIIDVKGLKNVKLEVTPEVVEQGQEAILRCSYELEDEPLYSLKFYRGEHEFYRYSPNERPQTKIFNFTWIEVDASRSSESQVTIRKVDFILKGNFSCEVTTNPSYTTMTSTKSLTVVSVPRGKPVIASERKRYEPGETLRANCSIPLSRPAARIFFTLNDDAINNIYVQTLKSNQQKLQSSRSSTDLNSIKLTKSLMNDGQQQQQYRQTSSEDLLQGIELSMPLQTFHYRSGQLNLRCRAKIADIYDEWSELQLGTRLREPVPERVRSSRASSQYHNAICSILLGLSILLFYSR
ncbi:uncharacterized protein LOC106651516 [Trichogramma pretiosum]|uniref:uncharacterized protein LOC106651516 n=1 Tax=Trichogramma pretiosum TaxID=7493 RepID=UPI0006C9617B|nr:uncharacterized protein LOC106651516 [Trichogramma pretiosum]